MYLDGFITMPTFRPDGRLDSLNKGKQEFRDFWVDLAQQANQKKQMQKAGTSSKPQQSLFKPSRPATSVSTPEATVGNRVGAKRKSLLGSASS